MKRLKDGYLFDRVKEISQKMKVSMPLILEIRHKDFTASYIGIGRLGIMFLSEDLISMKQIDFIIAHELAHRRENHILKILLLDGIILFFGFVLLKINILFAIFFLLIAYWLRKIFIINLEKKSNIIAKGEIANER